MAISLNPYSYHGRVRSLDQLQPPQEIYDLPLSGDQGIVLSFMTPSKR
jgi:hypothetical protein